MVVAHVLQRSFSTYPNRKHSNIMINMLNANKYNQIYVVEFICNFQIYIYIYTYPGNPWEIPLVGLISPATTVADPGQAMLGGPCSAPIIK